MASECHGYNLRYSENGNIQSKENYKFGKFDGK
jgi:antitoxin component YwqK of YwqJK toxin-antitoxin module